MNDAIPASGLLSFGSRRGREIVCFGKRAPSIWTPSGPQPLRPRPANDPMPPPMPGSIA